MAVRSPVAIVLDCINIIIPRAVLDKKYPGGTRAYISERSDYVGRKVWFDDFLVREGGMGPFEIFIICEKLKSLKFRETSRRMGRISWRDYCVVDCLSRNSYMDCTWLAISEDFGSACHVDDSSLNLVGPAV